MIKYWITILKSSENCLLAKTYKMLKTDVDNNISSNLTFKVYGTQNWGRTNFDNYDGSGDWAHYKIDVGSFYTGAFVNLFIANDDDGGGIADVGQIDIGDIGSDDGVFG